MRFVLFLAALPLCAHTISMSTAELTIEGSRGKYELRMPVYEVAHVRNPEQAFFEHVRFGSAKLLDHSCSVKGEVYVCTATYDFGTVPDKVEAECTFARLTVPNHVHVLKARLGSNSDQAVFDLAYEKKELRFRPPSAIETAIEQIAAGMQRAAGAVAGLLFLIALALASRSRRELLSLVAAFAIGEIAAAQWNLDLSPRFVEAAMALTVAYLAVEILFLPDAGTRWLICGLLGAFHGFYFGFFLRDTSFHAAYVLAGALTVELVGIALCWLIVRRFPGIVRAASAVLMTVGIGWFAVRLFR